MYTRACACRSKFLILEQKVRFRWCRRKPGIHKDNHPTRIRDTLHIHIYFLRRQVTSKSRQLFELVHARASSLAIQIQQVFIKKVIVAIISYGQVVKWPHRGNSRARLYLLAKLHRNGILQLGKSLSPLYLRTWDFRSTGKKLNIHKTMKYWNMYFLQGQIKKLSPCNAHHLMLEPATLKWKVIKRNIRAFRLSKLMSTIQNLEI